MPYVITDACIDVKDKSCLMACPVDCIYEGGRTLYIQPDECIDCGLCETVCPVAAIHADDRIPEELKPFIAVNREFFGPERDGLGLATGCRPALYHVDRTIPSSPPGRPGPRLPSNPCTLHLCTTSARSSEPGRCARRPGSSMSRRAP